LLGGGGMIEEMVVLQIYEELCSGAMGVHCTRHCDRSLFVFEAVVGLVLDGMGSGFLLFFLCRSESKKRK
jgi:hypothetical protein